MTWTLCLCLSCLSSALFCRQLRRLGLRHHAHAHFCLCWQAGKQGLLTAYSLQCWQLLGVPAARAGTSPFAIHHRHATHRARSRLSAVILVRRERSHLTSGMDLSAESRSSQASCPCLAACLNKGPQNAQGLAQTSPVRALVPERTPLLQQYPSTAQFSPPPMPFMNERGARQLSSLVRLQSPGACSRLCHARRLA